MSTQRYGYSGERFKEGSKHPNGRPVCVWCGGEVPKGRRKYCKDECQVERNVRASPAYARWEVEKRDKGVCAECGADTAAWFKELAVIRRDYGRSWELAEKEAEWFKNKGLEPQDRYWWPSWEADHIIPVVEGGGECGLENLRTLCSICHKKATRELHQRLKEARKAKSSQTNQVSF